MRLRAHRTVAFYMPKARSWLHMVIVMKKNGTADQISAAVSQVESTRARAVCYSGKVMTVTGGHSYQEQMVRLELEGSLGSTPASPPRPQAASPRDRPGTASARSSRSPVAKWVAAISR